MKAERQRLARAVANAIDHLSARIDLPADLRMWADNYTRGDGKPGRKRTEVAAVNTYQAALTAAFERWADDAVTQLADAPVDERPALLTELLAALLATLRALGVKHLPDAVTLGLDGAEGTPELFERLARAVADNDNYLTTSLIVAIRERLRVALDDDEMPMTADERKNRWLILLLPFMSRVGLYAGAWWILYQWSVLDRAKTQRGMVLGFLDPIAKHCEECPLYHSNSGTVYASYADYLAATGNRVPGQFECVNQCRCWLEVELADVAVEVTEYEAGTRPERFYNPNHDERGRFGEGGGDGGGGQSSGNSSSVTNYEKTILDKSEEHWAIVDNGGNVVATGIGDESEIKLSLAEKEMAVGATVTHNHPNPVPLSSQDVAFAALNGVSEIRAVARDDAGQPIVYSFHQPAGGWDPSVTNVLSYDSRIFELYKQNRSNGAEISDAQNQALTTFADEIGATYTITRPPP